jgi:hypothetical protein
VTSVLLRTTLAAVLLAASLALAACGDSETAKSPPGSPDNPLVSQAQSDGSDPDAPGQTKPGYKALVADQTSDPGSVKDSPCALVTKKQAQEAVGMRLLDPMEAPQGPTCIYRDRAGKTFVTLAVQQGEFRSVRRDVDRLRRVSVGDRSAYCGVHGAPMLYVPLGQGRMLSVTAQCEVAKSFARFAVPRLDG